MSFGKNKSKSEQTFDPELKGALLNVFGTGQQVAQTPYTPYPYASIAPMSPTELRGMQQTADLAIANVGQDEVNKAINTATAETGYQPQQVSAGQTGSFFPQQGVASRDVTARQMGMDRIGPLAALSPQQVQAEDITAGQFSQTNLTPYQNQFQQGVIDTALGDIERARQMQQNENAAAAVSAGAFGGSRQGLVEAETNRAALQQSADTAARLRQQGFESAAQRAESDIGRRMQADQLNTQFGLQGDLANQQAQLAADTTSAANELARLRSNQAMRGQMEQAQTQANLAADTTSAGNNLRAQMANQQARQFGQQLGLQSQMGNRDAALNAALANQQAGLAGSQQRLGAAQQLAGLGQGLRGMQFADAGQLTGVGQQQRQFGQQMLDDRMRRFYEQQEYPFRMFDVLRGAAGILPNPLTSSSYGRGTQIGLT